jgi:hypothetical protein
MRAGGLQFITLADDLARNCHGSSDTVTANCWSWASASCDFRREVVLQRCADSMSTCIGTLVHCGDQLTKRRCLMRLNTRTDLRSGRQPLIGALALRSFALHAALPTRLKAIGAIAA